MESLVKKYWWVVNLAVLALLAFLSAKVVNNYLAGEIAALEIKAPGATAKKPARLRGDRASAEWESIVNRNIFNSDPPIPEPPIDDDGGVSPPPPPPGPGGPKEGEPCEKSDAKISLLATMVATPSEWSMAVLDDTEASESRLMKELQQVGDYTITRISRARIVVRSTSTGKFSCVELGQKGKRGKSPKSYKPTKSSKSTDNSKIKDGIKKTGAYSYEIDRGMLNEQLEDLSKLSRQARVIPHYRGGKPQGFKIVGVRPGSLYSHIGVRSGDVIKGVNDEEITTPNKALELYEKLKNSDAVNVEVERRGRKVNLEYSIK